MSTILVSARVPSIKREKAASVLESIGATTSQLINSAFDYVIAHGQLPVADVEDAPSVDDVADFLHSLKLDVDWVSHDFDADPYYKQACTEGRVADYEALA